MEVNADDVRLASFLALVHRTRSGGLLEPPSLSEIEEKFLKALKDVKTKFKIRIEVKKRRSSDYMESILKHPVVVEKTQKISLKGREFFRR